MNKLTEEQLHKVVVADLSNHDLSTHTYLIPKYRNIRLETDKTYIIKLDDSMMTSNLIHTNFNKGIVPKYNYLKVVVSNIAGDMIHIDGFAYNPETKEDINYLWSGWVPLKQMDVIERI